MDSFTKNGRWIALGPDRKLTIPFTLLLCSLIFLLQYLNPNIKSKEAMYTLNISYYVALFSYLYTSLLDAGIIRPSEDNSIENKETLEPLGYTYCTICGLYRPPNAYHCRDCGVCYYKQCVAKYNTVSFYIFVAALLVFLISLEVTIITAVAT